jgi:hypothetical protein
MERPPDEAATNDDHRRTQIADPEWRLVWEDPTIRNGAVISGIT